MDDLISRAAALDAIDGMKPMRGNMEQLAMKALCWAAVKTIQPVDAAPVVRCRDCIHWQEPFDSNNIGYLVAHCDMFKDGDAFHERFYCAHGERRDEDATN